MLTRMDSQYRQAQKLRRKGAAETIAVLAARSRSWRGPDHVSGSDAISVPRVVSEGSCVWAFLVLGSTCPPEQLERRLHATGATKCNPTLKLQNGKLRRHHLLQT